MMRNSGSDLDLCDAEVRPSIFRLALVSPKDPRTHGEIAVGSRLPNATEFGIHYHLQYNFNAFESPETGVLCLPVHKEQFRSVPGSNDLILSALWK